MRAWPIRTQTWGLANGRGGSRRFETFTSEREMDRASGRFAWHCTRRAASRAPPSAGSSIPISNAMIAITTSSSISVNPRDGTVVRTALVR